MGATKLARAMCAIALFNGALFLCVKDEAFAGEREERVKKLTADLRKSKDAKARITALQELGELAQIKKSLVQDSLPDIYKAVEDKDPGVRAAAAETLGKADEPYDKAGDILVKMLKDDKETGVKIGAAKGLAAMGMTAKAALPALQEVVQATKGEKKGPLNQLNTAAKSAVQLIRGTKK
ncbi:HEAT repeat domain-containing protein [Gemmata sp. JC673]|uniref:HEAT repeat domain-containing protein n=1 Tax=Gemmata algarum TaxID=2975278 RepID=A0ABU5ERH9_9BACT|nr:HEAT repeat domain-containing protein [Gemmata algarum]MDY3557686.1 HEAT repeat domain-containing protein [Gemmata algarum]